MDQGIKRLGNQVASNGRHWDRDFMHLEVAFL